MSNKCCFFDRDGVLVDLVFHEIKNQKTAPWTRDEFRIIPGVSEALKLTRANGFLNLVISNQPDVLDGFISAEDCVYFSNHLKETLALDEIFECYQRGSWKYKPSPGYIDLAKSMFDLNLEDCYFIGDSWRDSVCAALRDITYIHIGDQKAIGNVHHVENILEAVEWILKHWNTHHG